MDEEQGDLNLLKLAADLRNRPDGFDYGTLRTVGDCGTVACAIGRTPEVFPDEIAAGRGNLFSLRSDAHVGPVGIACELFSLEPNEAMFLFYAGDEGMSPLPSNATAEQVARHIEDFVAKRRAKRVVV